MTGALHLGFRTGFSVSNAIKTLKNPELKVVPKPENLNSKFLRPVGYSRVMAMRSPKPLTLKPKP